MQEDFRMWDSILEQTRCQASSSEHHENKIESQAPFALVTGVQNGLGGFLGFPFY